MHADAFNALETAMSWLEKQPEKDALLKLMPGFEDCDENDVSEWLESDKNDHGYQILNYEEITNTTCLLYTSRCV